MKKATKVFILIFAFCFILSGCTEGETGKTPDTYSPDIESNSGGQLKSVGIAEDFDAADAEEPAEVSDVEFEEGEKASVKKTDKPVEEGKDIKAEKAEEKLVYTCDIDIETTTYKETTKEIESLIKKYNGIIERQEEYDNDTGWYMEDYEKTSGTMTANIVVRIPSKDYKAFINALDGKGKMTHKNMNVTNISRSYYDTAATVESLKIQEKRLLEMMKQAKTIDDMITIERRLTEVQTELNQNKTQLGIMDTEVAYSTVTLNVREVLEYKNKPEGRKTNKFSQRLINTLSDSWHNFLYFMEELLFLVIRFLPFAVLVVIVLLLTRPLRKKHKMKRAEKIAMRQKMRAERQAKKAMNPNPDKSSESKPEEKTENPTGKE